MTAIGRCPAPQNRDRRTGYCQSGIGTSPIYAKDRSNALSDTEAWCAVVSIGAGDLCGRATPNIDHK
jgi:hypothetical protein